MAQGGRGWRSEPTVGVAPGAVLVNLCCRPSSSFAHLLRHLPPTATANPRLCLPLLALPPAFPDAVCLSFSHHLRRLTLDAIAVCLRIRRDSISAACPTSGTTVRISY